MTAIRGAVTEARVQRALSAATAAWGALMADHAPTPPPVRDKARHARLSAAYVKAARRHLDLLEARR